MDSQNFLPLPFPVDGSDSLEIWNRQAGTAMSSNGLQYSCYWDVKSEEEKISKEIEREKKHSAERTKKRCNRYREALGKSWLDFVWQKKTHIHKFRLRQQKHRRPSSLPYDLLMGPKFVRYGHFCGARDNRPTRCPFGGFPKKGLGIACKNCTCLSFSLYPSPLSSVVSFSTFEENLDTFFNLYD